MAYRCVSCGKGPVAGKTVSHSHRVLPRKFSPNLQHIKVQFPSGPRRAYVCTRCIRSGKVRKAR